MIRAYRPPRFGETMTAKARNLATGSAAIVLCLALAACGGGEGGGWSPTSGYPSPPNPFSPSSNDNWKTASAAGTFNDGAATNLMNSTEFARVNATYSNFTGHPYRLNRVAWAHTASSPITGAGQLVAVVDDGFLITHQEFLDKDLESADGHNVSVKNIPNSTTLSSHGTHVAALIAGNTANSGTMFGIAPDADLFLSTYIVSSMSQLADATLQAKDKGAIAQNNSWGFVHSNGNDFRLTEVQDYANANNVSLPQALASISGISQSNWNNYASALNNFQSQGVIVWAMSNNRNLSNPDASSALPIIYPQLQGTWISVGNGAFDLDANDRVTRAYRLSAPCGQMATQCIFADGTTRSAAATGNSAYGTGTGTSFAAPQVSGSVALLAQAFPSLSPQEWTKRLFASAYNDFSAFRTDGNVNFGNGVTRDYSLEWGYGLLDIKAALSPIGNVSIISRGDTLETAERHLFDSTFLRGSSAFGDGLSRGLSDVDMVVYDDLNGDFSLSVFDLSLGNMVTSSSTGVASSRAIPRITPVSTTHAAIDRGSWGLDQLQSSETVEMGNWSFGISAVDGHEFLQDSLGLSSENVTSSSMLSFAQDTSAVVSRYSFEGGALETFGFVGTHSETLDGSLSGIGGALSLDFDPVTLKFGATRMAEQGAFLGMTANGGFGTPADTAISTFSLSASTELSQAVTLFGGIEYGLAAGGAGTGLLASVDQASFTGYQLGLRFADLWADEDRLTLTVSQPLRVESGAMSFLVPHRDPEGNLTYERVDAALQTSGRQVDLGLSYEFSPFDQSVVEFGFVYSADAGHIAGNEAAAIAAAFRHSY